MGCCKSKDKVKEPTKKTIQDKKTQQLANQQTIQNQDQVEVTVVNRYEGEGEKPAVIHSTMEKPKSIEISPDKSRREIQSAEMKRLKEKEEQEKNAKLQQQQQEILKLVEAKMDHLKTYLGMLNSNLDENPDKEDKTLNTIMKEIRDNHREIEGHIEELKMNPTVDKTVLAELINESQAVKKINQEHNYLKKNLKTYDSMRSSVLGLLKQIDPNLSSMKFGEDEENGEEEHEPSHKTPSRKHSSTKKSYRDTHTEEHKEESPGDFRERSYEEEQEVDISEGKTSAKGIREQPTSAFDFNFGTTKPKEPERIFKNEIPVFESTGPRVISEYEREIDKEIAIQIEKEKNDAIFELENAVIKYNRLRDDYNKVRVDHDSLKREYKAIMDEIQELKKANNTAAYTNDALLVENQTFQYIKDNLVRENERIKENYAELKRELDNLKDRAEYTMDNYKEEDNDVRIRQLELQIQQRKEAVKELEEKYKDLVQQFKAKADEVQREKAALYHRAASLDIDAINAGSKVTLHEVDHPHISNKTPKKDVASKILAESKISTTQNLIERARDARFDDLSQIQVEIKPTLKTSQFGDYYQPSAGYNNDFGANDYASPTFVPTTTSNKLELFKPTYDTPFARSYLMKKEKENYQYNGRILL